MFTRIERIGQEENRTCSMVFLQNTYLGWIVFADYFDETINIRKTYSVITVLCQLYLVTLSETLSEV